jgi:hypothetical protein
MIEFPLSLFAKDQDFPFYVNLSTEANDIYMHRHRDYSELVLVQNGTATHCVDNEQYFVRKGDVFVINSSTAHGYKNTNNFRICNIMYRSEKIVSLDSDIRGLDGFHALFSIEPFLAGPQKFRSRLRLAPNDFEKVNKNILSMIDEYEKKEQGWKMSVTAYFMMIVVALSRNYEMPECDAKEKSISIAKAVSYI